MTTITLKNIPGNVYKKLKKQAEINRRSINSEIIVCIERSLQSKRVDPDFLLLKARQLREKTAAFPVSDDDFEKAKAAGRP
jgi:plasmid stability protein